MTVQIIVGKIQRWFWFDFCSSKSWKAILFNSTWAIIHLFKIFAFVIKTNFHQSGRSRIIFFFVFTRSGFLCDFVKIFTLDVHTYDPPEGQIFWRIEEYFSARVGIPERLFFDILSFVFWFSNRIYIFEGNDRWQSGSRDIRQRPFERIQNRVSIFTKSMVDFRNRESISKWKVDFQNRWSISKDRLYIMKNRSVFKINT